MKFFISLAVIINTIVFCSMGYYTYQTYKITEKNLQGISKSIDTMNVRLKSINGSLDDKLYGIISNLPRR
jgi:uncharacterized protein YoxC